MKSISHPVMPVAARGAPTSTPFVAATGVSFVGYQTDLLFACVPLAAGKAASGLFGAVVFLNKPSTRRADV